MPGQNGQREHLGSEKPRWHGGHGEQGAPTPLIVRVFMDDTDDDDTDDIDVPDLYSCTSSRLAEQITKEYESFSEELGI